MLRNNEFWDRLFKGIKHDKKVEPGATTTETPKPKVERMKPSEYRLWSIECILASGDYGWSERKPFKKVILVNPKDCEDKITVYSVACSWKQTGHVEWEYLLASMFVEAVVEANKYQNNEADITELFAHDFYARNKSPFTQQEVYDHIIPWFDIIENTNDVLKLRAHV